MSNVKERPMSFTGEMVPAILDGRKTQTRRPIEPQPEHVDGGYWWPSRKDSKYAWAAEDSVCAKMQSGKKIKYVPGLEFEYGEECDSPYGEIGDTFRVVDTIYEITGIRIERLQDISEKDAFREGLHPECTGCGELFCLIKCAMGHCWAPECDSETWSAIKVFKRLWDSIYGKTHPWEKNDWVWVYSFKKVEREEML